MRSAACTFKAQRRIARSGRTARALPVAFVLAVAALGASAPVSGLRAQESDGAVKPAMTVGVAPIEPRSLSRVVVGTGSVVAWEELILAAEAAGLRVLEVTVDEGDPVKKGQVLVRFDDSILQAQFLQMEASIREAEATLEEARSNLERAKKLSRQAISEQALEQRQTLVRTGEAKLAMARAQRDELKARIGQATIKAPTDGYVSKRSVLIGNVVNAGTELLRVIRDGRLEVAAEVPELELDRVKPGQPVRVVHGTNVVNAEVRAIAPTVDPETRLGTVEIALPKGTTLKPGMFARAEIRVSQNQALAVPQEALVYRDGRPAVFEVGSDNRVALRPLETGVRQDGWVEVRTGVGEGTRIVVSGAGFLNDGDLVAIGTARAE